MDDNGIPMQICNWSDAPLADNAWYRKIDSAFYWADGRLVHMVGFMDSYEGRLPDKKLAQNADYDFLTRLPNRHKLVRDCSGLPERLSSAGGTAYMLYMDLDNFRVVNETLGQVAGDELLTRLGKDMSKYRLTQGHCYRYGEDDFVLLYENINRQQIEKVVDFLLRHFSQPWQLNAGSIFCKASIGVAGYPLNATNVEQLINTGTMLMYAAKRMGKGVACFADGAVRRPMINDM